MTRLGRTDNAVDMHAVKLSIIAGIVVGSLCPCAPSTAGLAESNDSQPATCERLASLTLSRAALESHTIAAGTFPLSNPSPDSKIGSFDHDDRGPAFCRVIGTIRPNAGSRIGFELWLPQQRWNGRLKMLGNGGYSSALPLLEMSAQLKAGYAVVATDTGHTGDGPEFAINHPESIVDWGHRAVHLTAVAAKQATQAFYGRPAHHAYFQGCSTGGHQAFMEAQRYPEDFDGLIAGAPGHNRTHLNAGFLWQFVQNREVLPASKLPLITRAAVTACRKQNGVTAGGHDSDPYLNDPLLCDFDPSVLTCTADETAECLTSAQVAVLKRMYAGAQNPRTGARIYFGWPAGSESSADGHGGWNVYWADWANPAEPARATFWRYWVFKNPQWNWRQFDFDRDMKHTDDQLARTINAMDPDLEKLQRRGAKLIHYHGVADPVVPFADSISYWQRVAAQQRRARGLRSLNEAEQATGDFYRLFLVPGLGHCQGGLGPAPVSLQQALEDWVERGQAPDRLLATREAVSRPLCPYPQIARYDGRGPPNAAASFICSPPTQKTIVSDPAPEYLR